MSIDLVRLVVGIVLLCLVPATQASSLSRQDFATSYLGPAERERISKVVCAKDAYLARCIGPVTRAANPRHNGKRLSPRQCRVFFRTQLDDLLQIENGTKSAFYADLPSELSESQARVHRQELTRGLQALVVESLTRQGAAVDKSPSCAGRLVGTIARIERSLPNVTSSPRAPATRSQTSKAANLHLQ